MYYIEQRNVYYKVPLNPLNDKILFIPSIK